MSSGVAEGDIEDRLRGPGIVRLRADDDAWSPIGAPPGDLSTSHFFCTAGHVVVLPLAPLTTVRIVDEDGHWQVVEVETTSVFFSPASFTNDASSSIVLGESDSFRITPTAGGSGEPLGLIEDLHLVVLDAQGRPQTVSAAGRLEPVP